MLDNLMIKTLQEHDIGKMFRVKRTGKDRDPLFWHFGKIHGLENLAFADLNEIYNTNGNPVKLQNIVNKYEGF